MNRHFGINDKANASGADVQRVGWVVVVTGGLKLADTCDRKGFSGQRLGSLQ